ncbi:MAG: GtrA family protein [Candidatus Cloacimonetes bacterium]|nr:GtrA family protein [Candidatus Cloacimonadota bacterium]
MKKLNQKFKTSFAPYFLVCIVAFLLDASSLLILVHVFQFGIYQAEVIGLLVGNTSNYLLATRFAFTDSKYDNKLKEFLYYLCFGMLSYPFHHLALRFSNAYIGVEYLAFSKVVAVLVSFSITYLLRKSILFPDKETSN